MRPAVLALFALATWATAQDLPDDILPPGVPDDFLDEISLVYTRTFTPFSELTNTASTATTAPAETADASDAAPTQESSASQASESQPSATDDGDDDEGAGARPTVALAVGVLVGAGAVLANL